MNRHRPEKDYTMCVVLMLVRATAPLCEWKVAGGDYLQTFGWASKCVALHWIRAQILHLICQEMPIK